MTLFSVSLNTLQLAGVVVMLVALGGLVVAAAVDRAFTIGRGRS